MSRVYNFSAGPSCLPLEVLEKASKELTCYGNTGMSVMEMSHRSKAYLEIIEACEQLLKELMNIPSNYKVLFIQGGASLQFAMVPLNLFNKSRSADYIDSGEWSAKAIKEAKRFGNINVVASSKESVYNHIPDIDESTFNKDADYFHITMNNTIFGTRFTSLPNTNGVPIVTDMSSCILSEVFDVSKFGIIYAGAQKNIGPAGLCIAIVRDDLVGNPMPNTPTMLDYKTYVDNGSMFNTPPTYGIYVAKLVFEWLKAHGGVPAIQKINEEKSQMLYDFLDNSKLFKATVVKKDRSIMNVPFVTPSAELDDKFVKESQKAGFENLRGHRLVGGMRASIYNAMPVEGVKALIEFMGKFELENK